MSYNRQLSPGGRRIANPGRASDGLTDPQRYERNNSYQSPRSSTGGVIPISTQTFVNYPPASNTTTTSRPEPRFDSYSGRPVDAYTGRPRRSSLIDTQRGSTSTTSALPSRSRPTVVQADFARPASPQKSSARDKEYYVQPASSKEPRKVEHKKLYSVDNGQASLVADVDLPPGGVRHHRRRDSETGERPSHRGLPPDRDNDRGRRPYHPSKLKEKSIEDDDAFSYTDAAGMFRDTEPRWREREVRPRRGSVDRGGASRERPVSMADPNLDPRRSNKDVGPPPSTRGWQKIQEGLGRTASLRDPRARDVPQSPNRARVPQSPTRARAPQSPSRGRFPDAGAYTDSKDPYYVAPRTTSEDRRNNTHQDRQAHDQYEYEERPPRRRERRTSVTRPDPSVERRGFGIRTDSRDRYGRASDESVERTKYRDSAYEPHRRDTAPEINYHEEQRLEQEKQDRMRAERIRNEDRDRKSYRSEGRDGYPGRDDGRSSNRDLDREAEQRRERDREYDLDRERERERERMMQRPSEPERHHQRRDSNREYSTKDTTPRSTTEAISQPGLSSVAATGIAGAAAAYGASKVLNRNDDRDRDRDSDRDREQDRRPERPREPDRERLSPRPVQPRPPETHSDEGVRYSQDRERDAPRDAPRAPEPDRGLGFAFEGGAPEPPRPAPPIRDPVVPRERAEEREVERQHEDKVTSQVPSQSAMDPDEDYRRRMEQVQRELGRAPDRAADDADRERRRREREQRQRERASNGEPSVAGTSNSYDTAPPSRMPGGYEDSVGGASSSRRAGGYEDSVGGVPSSSTRPGLARKSSILDESMPREPTAQIIDNSMSERKENRVRIVDPPTEEEERRPRGILKRPTQKFPEHPSAMREGVAPLKDASKSGIPPGARWTKIDRKLVNPEALEEAQERYEERMDCVIILRVLTKEEIQKLADRTKELRDERYEEERQERKAARRHERARDRTDHDEFDDDSENEFKPRAPKMLEAPSTAGTTTTTGTSAGDTADFVRERRREPEREHQHQHHHAHRDSRDSRDGSYASGGLGGRGSEY